MMEHSWISTNISVFNNQNSNVQGNVENILQVAASQKDYNAATCNVFLCKGYQFADNSANIQTFTPGQTVDMKIEISAPHTGVANVSVVSTKTNAMISPALISFSDYASNAHTIPANNTAFSITMPTNLGSQCANAGDCVVQWFWNAPDIKQTYESCIDFTMGGSGAGTPPANAPPASSPPASTPPATTTPDDGCDDDPATGTTPVSAPSVTATPDDGCDDAPTRKHISKLLTAPIDSNEIDSQGAAPR
jgi:hypothetical protein